MLSVSDSVRGAARVIEALRPGVGRGRDLELVDAALGAPVLHAQGLRGAAAVGDVPLGRAAPEVPPHDGLKVRARGRCTIYEGQGKFQLYVDALEPAGLGAQQLAFEQLKEKLAGKRGCSTPRASGRCRGGRGALASSRHRRGRRCAT